jgi:threonyl-tRNA synthetase
MSVKSESLQSESNANKDNEKHISKDKQPDLHRIRHSAAHIMAQAVRERFAPEGTVRIGVGPAIKDGFYYDFELPRSINEQDLIWIENRMKEIFQAEHKFEVREVTLEEAREIFANEPYKLELLDGLIAGNVDDDGNPLSSEQAVKITVYKHDTFIDLCRGPHVEHTGQIHPNAIKLLSLAGAYWRGDEKRPMLQRIYGTAWETPEGLEQYLWQRAEIEKRDHRRLGKELELFHLDPTAPGMPYWLPKGFKVLTELTNFWREEHEKRGYQEISSPLINEKSLWEISGHWEHYKNDMFIIPISEHITYGIKPMNCPNAMVVYNLKTRSYRDLPLRLSDCDLLHRNEKSGTLHGLLRVQKFQQDDAHIFVTEDQIEEEYGRIFEIADLFYRIFDLKYSFRLGTRPESYIGDIESWEKAEAALKRILDQHAGSGNYVILEGDGAFYGPKIDILMEDALGRSWQMGTIQLDFQLPRRFNCAYTDKDGHQKTPVVIHRVIYGSLERFMGILIEHVAGVFPVWLAPVQVKIIPIAEQHIPYALEVADQLRSERLRVEVDDSNKQMNTKIRNAQNQKVPYMLIVGNREAEQKKVSVRLRTEENLGAMLVDDFLQLAKVAISQKRPI